MDFAFIIMLQSKHVLANGITSKPVNIHAFSQYTLLPKKKILFASLSCWFFIRWEWECKKWLLLRSGNLGFHDFLRGYN